MKLKKPKMYKKCPRCANKCLAQQQQCEECGLIFSRMEFASNKLAKKKIRHFDRDFIIYTNQLPKDVSWLKLILYTLFFGLFGGHYYYVGKYVKGGLMSACFVYLIFCTVFNQEMLVYLESYYLYLPIGIMTVAWLVSLVYVCCKKFKVPVIVELPQASPDYDRAQFEQVKNDLKVENEKIKREKQEKSAQKDQSGEKK